MKVTNRAYDSLSRLGSQNPKNMKEVSVAESSEIGVMIERKGEHKATTIEIVVPVSRSKKGSRRASLMELNGSQARELYETLREFYETI